MGRLWLRDVEYLREGLVNSFSQGVGGDGIQVKKELVFDGGARA